MSRTPKKAAPRTSAAAKPARAKKPQSNPARGTARPSVAVLGGGIAGLTAALRLSKAGFAVTVFERDAILGGNTSSPDNQGLPQDVYPHLFCGWYANFWDLFEGDLKKSRSEHFEPREGVKVLHKDTKQFSTIRNPTSLGAMIENVSSGVMSPAQTFLLAFYGLDLVAHPFDRSGLTQLQELDVNGFLYSRGYSTEAVAKMENYILTLIWSIQSDQTAAATYQNFLRHTFTFPDHEPFAWFMRGRLSDVLIKPLEEELKGQGCRIFCNAEVKALRIGEDDAPLVSRDGKSYERFDFAISALPPESLSRIAMPTSISEPGRSLVDIVPALAETQRLRSVAIPVLNLAFKRRIPDFPSDIVGLAGSTYGLSVLDISQLWAEREKLGRTELIVAASNAAALPSSDLTHQGWLMIVELKAFFPELNVGSKWGDTNSDIDWERTRIHSNQDHKLTLNEVGSWPWRPQTHYPHALPRFAFAGDLVQNEVDMATVEGAVITGIQAARAIQSAEARIAGRKSLGKVIRCKPHTVYSNASLRLAYLALLPVAYGAFAKVAFDQWRVYRQKDKQVSRDGQYMLIDYLALVPLQYAIDWWKAAYWFTRSLRGDDAIVAELGDLSVEAEEDFGPMGPEEKASEPGAPKDRVIGVASAIMLTLGECADYAIHHLAGAKGPRSSQGGEQEPPRPDTILGAALNLAKAFSTASAGTTPKPARRGRIKH